MSNKEFHLRALEPEDLDVLYAVENDPALWCMGATNVPYSRQTLLHYITNQTGDIYADKQVRLMMEDEDGRVVGIIDLINFDPRHHRAEVGIVVLPEYRRRRYAFRALEALAGYAAKTLNLHQIYAIVAENNAPALALFEKSGFERKSTLSDWIFDGANYCDATLLHFFCKKTD